jgi:hypothetical protein
MADTQGNKNTSSQAQAPKAATIKREKKLDLNKYNVENLHYPIDLFSNSTADLQQASKSDFFNQQYLNYVVFYINVSDQSRVFTEGKVGVVGDVDKTNQNTVQGKQASIGAATGAAASGGAVVGGALGAVDGATSGAGGKAAATTREAGGSKSQQGVAFMKGVAGSVAGGAAGGALKGAVVSGAAVGGGAESIEFATGVKATNKIKRLKTAIALNVPNEVSVGYRATYGEEELGAIFGAAAEAATNPNTNAAKMGGQGAVMKGMEANPARAALSALYKAAPNPRKEQLFKSMEFRRFSFNYTFAPRSPKEAENVKRIINTFKFYMHPEFQNNVNKMLYLFPSEFDIVYYFGDKEHPHLNRISTCVLTSLNVNYSPNGQLATFTDGFPTQINVQMEFLELETLTKERFLGESNDGTPSFANQDYNNPNLPSF